MTQQPQQPRKPSDAGSVFEFLFDAGACNPESAAPVGAVSTKLSLPTDKITATIGTVVRGWAICIADTGPDEWSPHLFVSTEEDDALDSFEIIDRCIHVLQCHVRRWLRSSSRCQDAAELFARGRAGGAPAMEDGDE